MANIDYADLANKPFFPGLVKYMASGPVVAIVFEGLDAVKTGRAMLGATNPLASPIGAHISTLFVGEYLDWPMVLRFYPR